MRKLIFLIFIFFSFDNTTSQEVNIVVDWENSINYSFKNETLNVPTATDFSVDFAYGHYYKFVRQWEDSRIIDSKSVVIKNVIYSDINIQGYSGFANMNFPEEFKVDFSTSLTKNNTYSFLEFTPLIYINGTHKKIESFDIEFRYSNNNLKNISTIESSVLNQGDWYQFFIEETGVYKLDKNFLEQLGINVNQIDPRKIRIYGSGGNMLSMMNSIENVTEPIENSIKIIGEEDGVFDNEDYIIFYAIGPDQFNSESNTHKNLYEDQISYFLNYSEQSGLRVEDFNETNLTAEYTIDYYTNYKFHELDNYNIAQIGRRWFGDKFDFENQKTFQFEIENLINTEPVDFTIYAASTSEINTSMSVDVNGSLITNLFFSSINDPIMASGDSHNEQIFLNSSDVDINIEYNNNGNPSSIGYLDYISLEAQSNLIFNGGQLIFYNNGLDYDGSVVNYEFDNTQNIDFIWNISDISNVFQIKNENIVNGNFKSVFNSENRFIAFDIQSLKIPSIGSNPSIVNQNLKEQVFLNDFNQIDTPDYIIIARSDMIFQAERLAEINRLNNGLNVKVIDVEKIYNEFNNGNQDISAIRNFIRYVYDNQLNNDNLKYICLFGDASFDYKDRVNNNTNIIPSWHSLNSFSLSSSYISDDFFGMMDINEGMMTNSNKLDLAVGRILADSYSRAVTLVDKVESYYSNESYDNWRNSLVVIADDVDESWENIIQTTSNSIADLISNNKPFFNIKKILSDAYIQETSSGGERYPDVKNEIINSMRKGALVINYFGHGGEDGIARERIFNKIDAASVNNKNKLNCFVSVTCEFTKFDNPFRETAGEFLYWNPNGGSIALITTTRQIFVSVGVDFNLTLEEYLFSLNSSSYTSMAEALRLTKIDPSISNLSQRRLVFFIGDPAMKLSIPKPDLIITEINGIPINQFDSNLRGLDLIKIKGAVLNNEGTINSSYNGELTATVYDKNIQRSTLGNDQTTDNNGNIIILDYQTQGEVLFRGNASVINGNYEFEFIMPKDLRNNIGTGKFSFYSKDQNFELDNNGYNLEILMGGINENAEIDSTGPEIDLYMNDESFTNGGITNENPNLIVKLFDSNGINTSGGIGHDIVATIDDDDANSFVLNDYYTAETDDYKNGTVNFPLNNLTPGPHTLKLKAWDVYNNSSENEIDFVVFDENQELVIENLLNYPNPFIDYTEFWFNHNSSGPLSVSIKIFTISGKLVKTINGNIENSASASLSRDFFWDGKDDFGEKLAKGVYIYNLTIKSEFTQNKASKTEKLVIL